MLARTLMLVVQGMRNGPAQERSFSRALGKRRLSLRLMRLRYEASLPDSLHSQQLSGKGASPPLPHVPIQKARSQLNRQVQACTGSG